MNTIFRALLPALQTFAILASALPARAQLQVDRRIGAVFAQTYHSPLYIENRCHDNVARLLIRLRESGVNIHSLHALEIQNAGNYDFGLVAAQSTRTYPMNWGHHVVLFDGTYIYDFDFMKQPTPLTPPQYFHRQFKTEAQKARRELCDRVLGAYRLTFRPAALYLKRYANERLPSGYNLEPLEKRMRDLRGWGCDSAIR